MTYHALISPQGHVEYNATFVVRRGIDKLEHGQWYAPQELANLCGGALFLRESSQCIEKNIKKWRYEVQP